MAEQYRGIILAAGRGSRLGGLTDARPKCLVPLAGRPLLHWQLEAFRAVGVADVTVVRGYRKELLIGDFRTLDNPDWEKTNMVATLLRADEILRSGPTLISYSDIVYRPSHLAALRDTVGDLAICADRRWLDLWSLRFPDPLSDAETFREEGDVLREIGERTDTLSDIQGQYMGLLKATPQGWGEMREYLHGIGPEAVAGLDITGLLGRLLRLGTEIRVCPVQGGWVEVDNPEDITLYEDRLSRVGGWSHSWLPEGNSA
jgi:choline kinase